MDFLFGEKYTYLYAALTWDEYWANEKVYAAGNAAASAQLDSHEEHDLGAFDAVSRATVNHGLHRGSFQSTAVIYAKDGSSYTVSHWSEDGKTIYLADGSTVGWNRGTITKADGSTVQMDHYEVLGTKYVPVRVADSDLAPNRAFAVHCVRPQAERGHEHIQCAAKASEVPRANNSCPLLPRHSRSPVRRNPPGKCCRSSRASDEQCLRSAQVLWPQRSVLLGGDRDSRQD